jgi:hypothetical protein
MTICWREELKPGVALRNILRQATASLLEMDADRLEDMARCCADLNRELREKEQLIEAGLVLHEASTDIELLRLILRETRANLTVFSRLHVRRLRQNGGAAGDGVKGSSRWARPGREVEYGDN